MDEKSEQQQQSPPLTGRKDAIAVALSYEEGKDSAPMVSATGKGAVADQILQLALDHNVKIREDADLAQILASIEVDTPIPLEAFAAVSEILSYLYRAEGAPVPEFNFTQSADETHDLPD